MIENNKYPIGSQCPQKPPCPACGRKLELDGPMYKCEECMKMEFKIGSQWRTRGGTRAIVLDSYKVWHDHNCSVLPHNLQNGMVMCGGSSNYDLMEPWVDLKKGTLWMNVYDERRYNISDTKEECEKKGYKAAARIRIEWTEGQFDE